MNPTGGEEDDAGLELHCCSGTGTCWLGLELEMPGMKCTGFSSFLCRACAGRPLAQVPALVVRKPEFNYRPLI